VAVQRPRWLRLRIERQRVIAVALPVSQARDGVDSRAAVPGRDEDHVGLWRDPFIRSPFGDPLVRDASQTGRPSVTDLAYDEDWCRILSP
jgi:hypothetical protein